MLLLADIGGADPGPDMSSELLTACLDGVLL
jgi:hypothetical protein